MNMKVHVLECHIMQNHKIGLVRSAGNPDTEDKQALAVPQGSACALPHNCMDTYLTSSCFALQELAYRKVQDMHI